MLAVPEKITWALENHNSSVVLISNVKDPAPKGTGLVITGLRPV